MSNTIVYSAPGKVIISGEHAAVFGKPVLACAVDLRLTIKIKPSSGKKQRVAVKERYVVEAEKFVRAHLLKNNMMNFNVDNDYEYEIVSQIPVGTGMGSSAALSVAACAAFYEYYSGKNALDTDSASGLETINNLAFTVEKSIAGNPSGIDNTTSTFGGMIYFRKEFEFLKGIYKVAFKIPKNIEERLFLINSGKPKESTKEMIQSVGANYNKNPRKMEQHMNDIEKCCKRIVLSLVKEDAHSLMQQVADNQKLLEEIGIVSEKTKELLTKLQNVGVGKVTGAGGVKNNSGIILFYVNNKEAITEMKKICKSLKLTQYALKQSNDGVRKESTN